MADAISSSSESDFDGFTADDIVLAEEKENEVLESAVRELQEIDNESDIDLSDVDSDDSDGDEIFDSDSEDPVLRQFNLDWSRDLKMLSLMILPRILVLNTTWIKMLSLWNISNNFCQTIYSAT